MINEKILVIDTETCDTAKDENGRLDISNAKVYDIGIQIADFDNHVYEAYSWVVKDIFIGEREAMKTAYYADKIPSYWRDIWDKKRVVESFYKIKWKIRELINKYNIKIVIAHNARFDVAVLNSTDRYLRKTTDTYFFPREVAIWDSLAMARSTICKSQDYIDFCEINGYMTNERKPKPRATAEILHRFLSGDNNFEESHTALEDVEIETDIACYCKSLNDPNMKAVLYEAREWKRFS